MGSIVLVARLVLADVRRHRAQAVMLLLAVTVATATLALGLSLRGATDALYAQTRAATAGPDVVALSGDTGPAVTSALTSLAEDPEVVGHHGPYRIVYANLTARGSVTSAVVVHGFAERLGALNRPLVTSGQWVRPGGTVLERGFATALDVGVGDRVSIAGQSYPVVGIAVTAATSVYPGAAQVGPGGGPTDYTGLAWMTRSDARALAGSHDLPVTLAMDLKLRDPATADAFAEAHRSTEARVNEHSWQFKAEQDARILKDSQPILVVGSWLLSFLAVIGVAALAAGRAIEQTRRAGLLKAVGAGPGLIATVLLTEYLALALLGDALGLLIARLAVPVIASPTASRIGDVPGPDAATVITATVLAVVVAVLSTLRPTLRAMRTATVTALSATVRQPRHRPWLTALSALLPTPLLLGLRLTARRPGRAVLQACSTATTLVGLIALLAQHAQPERGYGLNGSFVLPNLRGEHDRRLLLAVTVLLIVLALVNTVTFTWTTAVEARANMAIARALGATPGQVSAGLSTAQLLPTLAGVLIGLPLSAGVVAIFSAPNAVDPPTSWIVTAVLATLLVTAALTALPARLAARRPVAQTLSAEAT
ncbi:FtsX-like permease family protein [Nonomuraea gerenzanensis]|uniref:ABC-type antimicrobial peptide transport system, permease component n=1 Tax=Nonomuraea gerenzanensis TaxID=93944 RepID=A0A1M4EPP4_9ACTN|nr:FtsX-like permease family protein [Nonomuraea gerenzanensis]SBP00826.1 ABC-type antimicrobial peptide transport system, permease component [Nonomuraea gerenzanensis]